MLIDKVAPYWTEEDKARLHELELEADKAFNEVMNLRAVHTRLLDAGEDTRENEREAKKASDRMFDLERQQNDVGREVEQRYIDSHSKKQILADAREIVNAFEKEDFLTHLEKQRPIIEQTLENFKRVSKDAVESYTDPDEKQKAVERNNELYETMIGYARENYENCYKFLRSGLRVQLNAMAKDKAGADTILSFIGRRVSQWYINPTPAFLPMAHGKATDAFAFMSTRNADLDHITGNALIKRLGVELVILKLNELQATLGISTDKLLSYAIVKFTQQNDFRHTKTQQPRREVTINLKEYATLLGYDVIEHETSDPEKEKKRAKDQLDNARKAIRKDLDVIHASTLTWEEPIKGKSRDFARVSLVTFTGIKNGEIKIAFTPEIASYLAERNLITQYPTKLLGISGRQPTAYYIGRKLAEHYNIDNNQIRGTNDRISIPALLAVTELPTYEEVMKQDRHWDRRIKEPLEQALDTLTQEGVLSSWEYTHAKGVPLTDEEAQNITTYEEFTTLYLHFALSDKIDHSERIQAKQEARAEAKRKKKPTKKKS